MKRNWMPDYKQMRFAKNDSYLHSVWIGCFVALFQLPLLVLETIVAPLWVSIKLMAGGMLFFLVGVTAVVLTHPLAGLMGRMNSEPKTEPPRVVD